VNSRAMVSQRSDYCVNLHARRRVCYVGAATDAYIYTHSGPIACWLADRPVLRACATFALKNACNDTCFYVCVKIDVKHARENTCKRAHGNGVPAFGLDEKLTFATFTVFLHIKTVCFYT